MLSADLSRASRSGRRKGLCDFCNGVYYGKGSEQGLCSNKEWCPSAAGWRRGEVVARLIAGKEVPGLPLNSPLVREAIKRREASQRREQQAVPRYGWAGSSDDPPAPIEDAEAPVP